MRIHNFTNTTGKKGAGMSELCELVSQIYLEHVNIQTINLCADDDGTGGLVGMYEKYGFVRTVDRDELVRYARRL